MKTATTRHPSEEASGPPTTWSLRGRTYVPEGGPPLRTEGARGRIDLGTVPSVTKREPSMVDEVTAARALLEQSEDGPGSARDAPPATWYWDLACDRVEWDERLKALFGHAQTETDGAWREERIHPEDRDRVKASLLRATMVSPGAVWSDQFRFREADGSYAAVTERACLVQDHAGPRGILGAIAPTSMSARPRTEEVP